MEFPSPGLEEGQCCSLWQEEKGGGASTLPGKEGRQRGTGDKLWQGKGRTASDLLGV